MNILVCLKRIADLRSVRIDPVSHALVCEDPESVPDVFDGCALEAAARINDRDGSGAVYALAPGSLRAEEALRESLTLAADAAVLADTGFSGGPDVLAETYLLGRAIRKLEQSEGIVFDAVFLGGRPAGSAGSDTGRRGTGLAETLGRPQVGFALTAEHKNGEMHVGQKTGSEERVIAVRLPCIVTFANPGFAPRVPSPERRLAAQKAEIRHITLDDILCNDRPEAETGRPAAKAIPAFVPRVKKAGVIVHEKTAAASARKLASLLIAKGIL